MGPDLRWLHIHVKFCIFGRKEGAVVHAVVSKWCMKGRL